MEQKYFDISHKNKILFSIVGAFAISIGAIVGLSGCDNDPTNAKYNSAISQMEKGSYSDAINSFQNLGDYSDSKNKIIVCEGMIALTNSISSKSEEEVVNAIKKITNTGEWVNVSYVAKDNHVLNSLSVDNYSDIHVEDIKSPNFSLYTPKENKGYSFINWTTVSAYYKQNRAYLTLLSNWELLTYSIIYNLDGGVNDPLNPDKYDVNTDTIVLNNPTKENFEFVNWTNKQGFIVTKIPKGSHGDVELTANWKKHQISYFFVNYNGEVLDKGSVDYGCFAIYGGKTPFKDAPEGTHFDFIGWDKDPKMTPITSETIFTAQFKNEINSYEVLFKNYDGTVLERYSVNHGCDAIYSKDTPIKPNSSDDLHFYTFIGWDKPLTNIHSDTVFTAQYKQGNRYLASFYDGNTVLQSFRYNEGETPNYIGNTPTKPTEDGGNLYFKKWSPEITPITKDTRFDAIFATISEIDPLPVAAKMLEGEPYKIVIPSNGSAAISTAANEIKNYFKLTTNADIKITNDIGLNFDNNSRYISIGNTSIYQKATKSENRILDLSKDTMNTDGFYLLTINKTLLINAYNDRGLLYGAYQFIEDSLGVKFLTNYYTHIPELSSVNLYDYDKAYVPCFDQRAYLNGAIFQKDIEYCSHMRFNTDYCRLPSSLGGSTNWAQFNNPSHTMGNIVKRSEFDPYKYPEIYAHTGKGSSALPNFYFNGDIDYCYSHGMNEDGTINENITDSAIHHVVDKLINEYVSKDSKAIYYMIGQSDVENMCPCDECRAAASKYKASGVMIRFANAIANKIQEYFDSTNQSDRELYIVTFAYNYSINAPVDKDGKILDDTCIPNDRVIIKYAPYYSTYYYGLDDPKQGNEVAAQVKEWGNVANNLMAWTYHSDYLDSFWYYPGSQNIQKTMKTLKRMGCSYHFAQGNFFQLNMYKEDIDAYIFSKLCWNIDTDPTYFRNEFIKYMFGEEAYSYAVDFHNTIESTYAYMDGQGEDMTNYSPRTKSADYWTDEITKCLVNDFEKVQSTINTSKTLSEERKTQLLKNSDIALITARYMRLEQLENYSDYDETYIKENARNWLNLARKYGIKRYGEPGSYTLEKLAERYGV